MKNKHNTAMAGFISFKDFFYSAFMSGKIKLTIMLSSIAVLTTFITSYIWNSAPAIYFLASMVGLDFITGIAKSIKSKTFSSSMLPRAFVILLAYCLLLSMAFWSAKFSTVFSFLPGLIYGSLISTLIISVLENMNELGILPQNLVNNIISKLSLKKDDENKDK